MLCFLSIAAGLALFFLFLLGFHSLHIKLKARRFTVNGKHVFITGGSSGIGLALGKIAHRCGANVTLLARNEERLKDAKAVIKKANAGVAIADGWVDCLSLDISHDPDRIRREINLYVEEKGSVDMLFNCAGYAVARSFLDTPVDQFTQLMSINYLSAVYVTRALLPSMLPSPDSKTKKKTRIVMVSSMAGQLGVFGYTGYSASKFALRGFAETLRQELGPSGAKVCLAFPPDTDTPGYQTENVGKPLETQLISAASGLYSADQVARHLLQGARAGRFFISVGLDGFLLTALTAGMVPLESLAHCLIEAMTLPLLRVVAMGYAWWMNRVVAQVAAKKSIKKD